MAVGEREVVLSEEEGADMESGGIGIIPWEGVVGSEAELIELVLIEFEFGGGFGDLAFGAKAEEVAEFGLCASAAEEFHTEPEEVIEVSGDALVVALVGWEFVDDFA